MMTLGFDRPPEEFRRNLEWADASESDYFGSDLFDVKDISLYLVGRPLDGFEDSINL